MFKKGLVLILLLLLLMPVFSQETPPDPTPPPQPTNPDIQAIRSQLDVMIRQNAEFRENLNNRLINMPDKNYVVSNLNLMDTHLNEESERRHGIELALGVAFALCGSALTLMGLLFLRMKGLF